MSGWNLPPGCTNADIDRAMGYDDECEEPARCDNCGDTDCDCHLRCMECTELLTECTCERSP